MSTSPKMLSVAALLALGLVGAPSAATAADPAPEQVAQIEQYYESGAWARETARVAERARASLRERLRSARDARRLVAVFDVDDTALSTYECMKAGAFADARRTACVLLGPHPAIAPTLRLFRFAQQRKVSIAFVTGRPEFIRTTTLAQLRVAGFRGRYELLMRPSEDERASVVPFKSSARKRLQRGGRKVAINVGDQASDLAGGFAQRTFKLPNPMYTLP